MLPYISLSSGKISTLLRALWDIMGLQSCEVTSHLAQDQESVPSASQVKEEVHGIGVTEKELSKLEIKEVKGGANWAGREEDKKEAEACWATEEKGEEKEELEELIQEDPWTGEWVEFKVPCEYAKREWR